MVTTRWLFQLMQMARWLFRRTSANHSESDYQQIREANIAQNKKILCELGFLGDKTDEDGKKVKKGTNDRKNEAETGTR